MKVLIIEDEKPASQKLIRLLRDNSPGIEIMDVLRSVEQSVNWFSANPDPDLIFMDIQLEDGICFEIFENYKLQTPVVFTTAYDQYTLKAFKINSIDYLLKPVSEEELKGAMEKYNALHTPFSPGKIETMIEQFKPAVKERFLVKVGVHYKTIQASDINCFYIKERCNFMLLNTGKSYPVDYSLDKIEQLVDSNQFYRVSRNFIINLSAIADIIAYSSHRLKVVLDSWVEQDEIIVSRDRVAGFKEWMDR